MFVFAGIVFATSHKVKKAGDIYLHFLGVGKPTLSFGKLAFVEGVEDAGLFSKVVGKAAFVSLGTIVLVI